MQTTEFMKPTTMIYIHLSANLCCACPANTRNTGPVHPGASRDRLFVDDCPNASFKVLAHHEGTSADPTPKPPSSARPPPCAADVLAVNTNDAFMGIDSESLYSGSKSFPPAFDAGETCLSKCPEMCFRRGLRPCFFCARYEALACYCCVCRDRSFL